MKILFHFTIALLVLSLVACNQTKSPEPVKQYTFIGGKEGDKIDTTSFDSLQLSDPFILADHLFVFRIMCQPISIAVAAKDQKTQIMVVCRNL